MSLQPAPCPVLPEATAKVAKAAFKRKGNIYLTIGDQLDSLFADVDFAPLYAADGKPALSPNLLALVTVFQFMENLPDRDAADAVRSRIDWKYALHLALDDMGFDASVLSEFRQRLAAHGMAQAMFDQLLERFKTLGWLHAGGKQRTDATYVLGATQLLNRLQLVAETMRLALEALADYRPDWLRQIALPHWYERYSLRLTDFRLPRTKEKQEALAMDIGRDGFHLLQALTRQDVPSQAASLPAVQVLAQVWQQQFEQDDQGPHWRRPASQPPAGQLISTPHDPAVRFAAHGEHHWQGYALHWTETCDDDQPHLITNVALPAASTGDASLIAQIHAALAERHLLPKEHLVDAGYVTGPNLAASETDYGVRLVGPIEAQQSWQARQPGGFTTEHFAIDWAKRQAICPQGQRSSKWSESTDKAGQPIVEIAFPKQVCNACPVRSLCTRSTTRGRGLSLSIFHDRVQKRRAEQETEAFKQAYALRVGIEGTISATVRQHGMRRTRYCGQPKTEVQALLTAIAVNVRRMALWLMGERPTAPRPLGLGCLAPA